MKLKWPEVGEKVIEKVIGKRPMKGPLSSTSKKLAGTEIFNGTEIIKEIRKGLGDRREIVCQSGARFLTTRPVLHHLISEMSTRGKIAEFAEKALPEQLDQISASLGMRRGEFTESTLMGQGQRRTKGHWNPLVKKEMQTEDLNRRARILQDLGVEQTPHTWLNDEKLYLPTPYAEVLEKFKKGEK